ncbi:hypothetical protein Syun_004812 [Stephania yunnanensis]|uniref:LMBR1-like membrane protein n=1 Tax=Stephania yunnanensis TaxID=152371 RepID=A0AAP0L4N3_9MAGN
MWVFYLISLPLTVGMVIVTLKYFAGPHVPRYVLFTVGYAWFCSISIIILVPADIWTTIVQRQSRGIAFFWSWSYWSTFLLTWAVVPTIQGYEDAGDFTVTERLKTSLHSNLVFYLIVGSFGLLGLILLIIMHGIRNISVVGLAMACSNTFGLVTGAFLLGFGLSEIPKSIWKDADWSTRHKVLSHKIAKMALKLDDAHQEFSNAIVVAQATSNQMSKRDPLRPYMDIIDNMLRQMFIEDPAFKPQGGRLGENDMDYDTDEKSMATLRRQLMRARDEYYRYKSEYMAFVMEALELEDTIKNYERRHATGWFGLNQLVWRCILRKQLEKVLAAILGCMMVARYAPPISYNFLNLIRLDGNAKTIFEKRMGNIDDAVPLFGKGFNKIYPLIMVIYTLLVASNFFDRVISFFGSWKRFRFQNEAEDMDGFDASGIIILQKERSWLEQGRNIGDHVIPLARNFNDATTDIESGSNSMDKDAVELKTRASISKDSGNGSQSMPPKDSSRSYNSSREDIGAKYAAKREQQSRQSANKKPTEKNITSATVSLLTADNSNSQYASANNVGEPSSGIGSTWASMRSGFQSFKANIGARRFLPLRQSQEPSLVSRVSSSESLDEIFQRLKKRPAIVDRGDYSDEDEVESVDTTGPKR